MRQPTPAATATRPDPVPVLGFGLTAAIAALAFGLHTLPPLAIISPAILAAVIGLACAHLVRLPAAADPGIAFSSRTLLRTAIALLGLQVTVPQLAAIGPAGFAIAAGGLALSFVTICVVGRILGVEPRLAQLIAAGTSICGASAVAGVNTVTEAGDDDVAYAVAMVTLFGTIAMLTYPLIGAALGLDGAHYGLWAGASIHEVAQVAGATAQFGPAAVQTGTVAKLTRIALLAPLVMGLGLMRAAQGQGKKTVGVPWFLLVFAGLVVLGSIVPIPAMVRTVTGQVAAVLLAAALAGMGLKTHAGKLAAKGWRPLALGAFGTLFIACTTLAAVVML